MSRYVNTARRHVSVAVILVAIALAPRGAAAQQDIEDTLGIGFGGVAGISQGRQLLAHTVDTSPAGFPEALCNDGSPAVFYFRPHEGADNADRWLIMLMGGGFCTDFESCSRRWKKQDLIFTAFGSNSMSTEHLPPATNGNGLLERSPQNPFGDWNQVLIHYCSSDRWTGTSTALVPAYFPPVPLIHPQYDPNDPWVTHPDINSPTGVVQMQLPFLGRKIFDAVIDTLRRDSPDGTLQYGGPDVRRPRFVDLPDLDDAGTVVLAGGSAGGAGTINNLDHLTSYLLQNSSHCVPGDCSLRVAGIPDSAFPPLFQGLDFSQTHLCLSPLGRCTYDEQMLYSVTHGTHRMWDARGDSSCLSWHAANAPLEAARCAAGPVERPGGSGHHREPGT
jgi:hypothetical protein